MPSFLHNLRRRSKASFVTTDTHHSSSSNEGNEEVQQHNPVAGHNGNKSSSTLSSWFDKQSPPTTLASSAKSRSSSHLPYANGNGNGSGSKTPPLPGARPGMPQQNNRYSLVVSDMEILTRVRTPPLTRRAYRVRRIVAAKASLGRHRPPHLSHPACSPSRTGLGYVATNASKAMGSNRRLGPPKSPSCVRNLCRSRPTDRWHCYRLQPPG